MPPKKKKKDSLWRNSKARELLLNDMRSGAIPADMDWKDAFPLRPEFNTFPSEKKTPEQLFSARLSSAREIINAKNTRAADELAILRKDRKVHPVPLTNHRGEPR